MSSVTGKGRAISAGGWYGTAKCRPFNMLVKSLHRYYLLGSCLLLAGLLVFHSTTPEKDFPQETVVSSITNSANQPILPILPYISANQTKVQLGEKLFHEPMLSENGRVSCSSCHNLKTAGHDGLPTSIDIRGGMDELNTPTLFNASLNYSLSWTGHIKTLEEQIETVMHNPKHMGSSWERAMGRMRADKTYQGLFQSIYPDGVTDEAVIDALSEYERTLITPDSPFDRYLKGELNAINKQAKAGYELFKSYGCISCHQGQNVGGQLFAKFGLFRSFFNEKDKLTNADLGRYRVTGKAVDRHVFRVPSLRNVARTAPYFHDGSITTLPDAVRYMGDLQLGRRIPDEDVGLIVSFLESLTGIYQGRAL
ncbi:MAG: c-type cytochrome [Sedimenticola sp.]|nr:c-type cytochrome [Sedimenticola sp.]